MKRTSERQITKDDADLESEDEAEATHRDFDRAPPEVMAKRRIVKVRRTMTCPTNGGSINPFATTSVEKASLTKTETGTMAGLKTNPFAALASGANAKPTAPPLVDDAGKPSVKTDGAQKGNNNTAPVKVPVGGLTATEGVDVTAVPESTKRKTQENETPERTTKRVRVDDLPLKEQEVNNSEAHATTEKHANVQDAKEEGIEGKETAENISITDGKATKNVDDKSIEKLNTADVPVEAKALVTEKKTEVVTNISVVTDADKEKVDKESGMNVKREAEAKVETEGDKNVDSGGKVADSVNASTTEVTDTDGVKADTFKAGPAKTDAADKSSKAKLNANIAFGGLSGSTPVLTFATAAKGNGDAFTFNTIAKDGEENKGSGDGTSYVSKQKGDKQEFKEKEVQTGEEDEEEMFRARAKLYVLEQADSGARWKERGVGPLKIKRNKESGQGRLLMRTEATLRVVLNSPLFNSFVADKASDRSVRFQGFEHEGEGTEEGENKKRSLCFLVRFSTKDIVKSFMDAVESWKKTAIAA